ncbi:MAG: MFS transporter, partial [Chloroflexi bacterium]|nr:MFS transporter [Chloroflexota bacterium]
DRLGERRMMPISYIGLALCALGYAFIQQTWLLVGLLVLIKILMVLGMGLSTYVNRVAPAEELSPTLTAGVSINHISSVAMPLVAGVLLPVVGYSGIYLGTAILIAFSVPFALGLRIGPEPVIRLQSAPAE